MSKKVKLEILRAQLKDMLAFIETLPIPEGRDKMYWIGGYPGYPDEYNPSDWLCDTNIEIADEWDILLCELKRLEMTAQLEAASKLEIADLLHYTAEVWDNEFGQ